MVYLTQALKENGLRIEWFHRGRFLIIRQFEEIAFCSKDAFKVGVSTVERQLIQKAVYLCHGGRWWRGRYRYGGRYLGGQF